MMTSINRFFLSRSTILTLILLTLAAVTVGAIVPQAFITGQAELDTWRSSHLLLSQLSDFLGLFHIYTTPGFALLLLFVCISLGLSTYEQGRSAWKKTFSASPPPEAIGSYAIPADAVIRALRKNGYVQPSSAALRFVKHPWGYWGGFSLHLGILVCIAASLLITLTQQRGSIDLIQGETHLPGSPWLSEENGLLAGTLVLPEPVRFERLRLTYGTDTVKAVETDLVVGNDQSNLTRVTTAINAPLSHLGLTIYQGNEYGKAFIAEVTTASGAASTIAYTIRFPSKLDQAGYSEFRIPEEPKLMQAKYYSFSNKLPLRLDEIPLTLRLMENGKESQRITLRQGESGMLGENRINILEVRDWGRLIFVRLFGIEGVFAGFFLIVTGAALTYCTSPQEAWIEEINGGVTFSWRSARFAEFCRDELTELVRMFEKEG